MKMTQIQTISETQYKKKASKYIEILNQLRSIGAHFTVNLPTIVFCGNQSAGKSSLLEAISGVQLPRSDGTCTRCVMELRLTESKEPWQCQVFLRREYDENEKLLPCPEEKKFGNRIDNPEDVELMARKAQKALLNPSISSEQYFDWDFNGINYEDDANSNNLKFTKNVVCLEIKGENVPNLSLIDLPGIIRHTEKIEDRKFVDLILELVKSYIKKEESIIIATISCKDEIDNQEIVSLARTVDPLGLRTLGVLTKPDTIELGTHESWLKIMRGEAHKLSLGYYVIKNPNKQRLMEKITFEKAREEEIEFFNNESQWNHFGERIGVAKLQSKLSDLLVKAIMNGLPIINKEFQRKLEETRRELENIPKPLGKNPRVELYHMIRNCARNIKQSSDNGIKLWSSINKEFAKFKSDLCSSRPIFPVGKHVMIPEGRHVMGFHQRVAKFDSLEEFVDAPEQGKEITEEEVSCQISNARGKLLPGFVPYAAVENLINDSRNEWKIPSHECLVRIYEIMADLVNNIVDETFSRFPNLHVQVLIYTNKLLDDCKEETTKRIDFMYELERANHPFTLNDSEMIKRKAEYHGKLRDAVKNDGREPTDALEVIASVLVYYSLALKRYADIVSMTIIHCFINGFVQQIEEKLAEEFISNYDDFCELVQEDQNISNIREELIMKEKHMKEVLDSLIRFGIK